MIVNTCSSEVSSPPFAVPPSSCKVTPNVALPAFPLSMYESVPSFEIATLDAAPAGSEIVRTDQPCTCCPASSGGPNAATLAKPGCSFAPDSPAGHAGTLASTNVGASFTASTVIVAVATTSSSPSLTTYSKLATPFAPPAAV